MNVILLLYIHQYTHLYVHINIIRCIHYAVLFGVYIKSCFNLQERRPLTIRHHGTKLSDWDIEKEPDGVQLLVKQSGLMNLCKFAPDYVNKFIVSGFVERWMPETNSFHLPFGEMTITLDDIEHICGIPIMGKPVTGMGSKIEYEDMIELMIKTLGCDYEVAVRGTHESYAVTLEWIRALFAECPINPTEEELKQRARGFLWYLLGCTLFTNKSGNKISVYYLECLSVLEDIGKWAWGSAALAMLYKNLGQATRKDCKQIAGYLPILEVNNYFVI